MNKDRSLQTPKSRSAFVKRSRMNTTAPDGSGIWAYPKLAFPYAVFRRRRAGFAAPFGCWCSTRVATFRGTIFSPNRA